VLQGPFESGQYTSLIFTRRCRSVGIEVSMGSRGDCFDNAAHESFHATLKKDLIHRRSWPTKAQARSAVFEYIEAFYNRRRRHSRLGMRSPLEFENRTRIDHGAGLAASRLVSSPT
jgi:putative transposase